MYDDFDQDLVGKNKNKNIGNLILLGLTSIIVFIFIFILYKSYLVSKKNPEGLDNLIGTYREDGEIKTDQVENHFNVENLDKDFYQEVSGEKKHEVVQIIEEEIISEDALDEKINDIFDKKDDDADVVVPNTEEVAEGTNPSIREVYVNANAKEEGSDSNEENQKKSQVGSTIRIQVGALRTRDFANDYINELVNRYPSLFKSLTSYVEKIDLNEKGIFYRVQFGDFTEKSAAKDVCQDYIKVSNGKLSSCILVNL